MEREGLSYWQMSVKVHSYMKRYKDATLMQLSFSSLISP